MDEEPVDRAKMTKERFDKLTRMMAESEGEPQIEADQDDAEDGEFLVSRMGVSPIVDSSQIPRFRSIHPQRVQFSQVSRPKLVEPHRLLSTTQCRIKCWTDSPTGRHSQPNEAISPTW
jgi:hypothetical protein